MVRRLHVQSQLPPARRRPKGGDVALQHCAAVVDHGDFLAEILHEVELVAGEEHRPTGAGPRRRVSDRLATATGSRPANGSSSTMTAGSWTRDVASWRRCCIPPQSLSVRSLHRSSRPSSSSSARPARRLLGTDRATCRSARPGHRRHPRVEPAFLRHVAPVATVLLAHKAAVVHHLSAVGTQHSEHDPQQRRLAGAVGPEQPCDHPRHDGEAHPSRASRLPNECATSRISSPMR